ncbi:tetratricopeptide repeat protein [Palleronia sediminis]|uniref:Tetratricopeptide repeat protein n=1 Tax=Palleronia sediminis TaxID=2547833 RepID=A0A4R6A100_9RHOB|nr:tetratricopeptide repeat protein [Palleronia sediminis]TDL76252.1 tetratricopeptide repeat protein [Palleronia sediminis]
MFRPVILAAALAWPGLPALAQDRADAGAYLAGRSAQLGDDFQSAAGYLARAYAADPANPAIAEGLLGAEVALGAWDRATEIASAMRAAGSGSQVAALALLSELAARGDWSGLLGDLDGGLSVGPLFDGLARGWALLGDDRDEEALAAFDRVSDGAGGVGAFGRYHKALALGALGRFDEAAQLLDEASDMRLSRRGLIAQAQILSHLDRHDDARRILDAEFGAQLDPALVTLDDRLAAGEVLEFTIAPDARAGIAEANYDIASVVTGETAPGYALLYSRLAEYLRPSHTEAILLSAALLEEMEMFDLASEAYDSVAPDDPAFATSELGRAEVLRASGREEEAIATLRALAAEQPELQMVRIALGDMLREMERHAEARQAYDEAVALFEEDDPAQWVVYFARGITAERVGDWDAAEADMRKALELRPDQPNVLNYLGYSLVERGERLEEALEMIEAAVAGAPNSGYIIDSLGWAFYRLGRYDEAVAPMERAVELMPVDPVVNDHLGDVFWAVGRELEARFQWQRALSFVENGDAEEVNPERIRRKLEIGLDAVLAEEGAPPLRVANDD